jgi:group II intron reverse transcriptase/maturase
MQGTPSPESVSTRLQRIAELARKTPELAFTTLAHHIDVELLHEAYRRTRKDGATGIDGQTATEYAANLEGNLQSLLNRFKSGTYRAPPVRRVYIPKADGRTLRPIGIPTFEDKVLQRAVTMVLEAIYEQDFLDCSYGFRPNRSAHQALEALWRGLMEMGGGVVIEVDIKSYFDTVEHRHIRSFLDKRVRDGVLRRAIDKWLKAGVFEEGSVHRADEGSPQGGVVSPLLSNIYLHEVLDTWFATDVVPRLRAKAFMVRYADDAVIVLACPGRAIPLSGARHRPAVFVERSAA